MRLGRMAAALAAATAAALACCRCCSCEGASGTIGGAAPSGAPSSSSSSAASPPLVAPRPPRLALDQDPLDLAPRLPHDYRNWASLLARVLLTKAGGDGEAATAALGRVMLTAHGLLARSAEGGEDLAPRLHLTDPVFGADAVAARAGFAGWLDALDGKKAPPPSPAALLAGVRAGAAALGGAGVAARTHVTGALVTHNFIEFTPCVLGEAPTGVAAELTGLNFAPNLVSIAPAGLSGYVQGLNIQPALIFIQPAAININPELFNFQPALLYIGPIGVNLQPQGMDVSPVGLDIEPAGLNYQPSGLAVEPTRFGYTPTKVCYNPIKHVVSEAVRVDLYRLQTSGDPTPDEKSDGCRRRLLRRL